MLANSAAASCRPRCARVQRPSPAAAAASATAAARRPAPRRRAAVRAAGSAPGRLQRVLDAIDALNAKDPRSTAWRGEEELPYELAYSRWLSDWVARLEAAPSEELRIAARGQHVERWKSPRSSYPEGRAGYLKWRADLKRAHADTVAALMAAEGYEEAPVARVRRLINKLDLKTDPENQVLEDALCLVFLEHQFTELIEKEGADKMVDIVQKTWGKMGERGRAAALKLPLSEAEAAVVQRALAG
ncbi:hypothetical protein Rsub_04066 [Raphidocelis subcapitata]|uniref:DUF4202 domain-containing protein n=1 Tax=Raphidocelis subcapitata TaxID=307507 RepID=A0A2V0NYL0_9CHLO|nr:hypothetical protein Rsub_04066 [Raphidocelis subcapitata]|eukprot:GBF91762.1 hypothetical protein Rsub_04066 [Raphidocelis subcapitata]